MLAPTNVCLSAEPGDALPLLVRLPPEMAGFFREAGYAPTTHSEKRCNARVRVRCESVITSLFLPPFVRRGQTAARVLVKDLSRTGISILAHQQMWPTETFALELHRRRLSARVVRCRKIADYCYEVGAVIFDIETP
ncbi:MAG: hypothetical protein ACTHOU_21340 [Aureliella sp.]